MAMFYSLPHQSLLCLSLGCAYKSVSGQIHTDRSGRSPGMGTGCTLQTQHHPHRSQILQYLLFLTVFFILSLSCLCI